MLQISFQKIEPMVQNLLKYLLINGSEIISDALQPIGIRPQIAGLWCNL